MRRRKGPSQKKIQIGRPETIRGWPGWAIAESETKADSLVREKDAGELG